MSALEDEIRESLRSEATRLREVRPLQLPAGEKRQWQARSSARGERWRPWLAPVAAMAAVVVVAATLVTLRSFDARTGAGVPASGSPIAGPALPADATPAYSVSLYRAGNPWTIAMSDSLSGKIIATYTLPPGGALSSAALSGAPDDRTFVVSAAPTNHVGGTPVFYLVRLFPGSAQPLRVTKLPLDYPAEDRVSQLALSADGTELAVVSEPAPLKAHLPSEFQVFSVASGQLQHSWAGLGVSEPVTGLSWVGDRTVGFTVTRSPEVREEVRTLDVSKTGKNLIADSRLVWSQYVPAAPHGTAHAPHACDSPVLTGDGKAVACGNATYSAATKRMTVAWLAYPLATPTRPRVIGRLQEDPDVSNIVAPMMVIWVNPSGTKMIGWWGAVVEGGVILNYGGITENGQVKHFPPAYGPVAY
jgi:hypothetical protein